MKNIITLFTVILLITASCSNSKNVSESAGDTTGIDSVAAASATSQTWIVDTKASSLIWKGTKPNVDHIGTISIKEGSLSSENGVITAGKFIMDMSTIAETTHADDAKSQDKLVTHLKSSDFFNVDSFPTSTFAITKVDVNMVYGNLTIKNITHEIKFAADIKIDGAKLNATTGFEIDRTDWEINFNSGKKLKDMVANKIIGDKISYKLTLVAYKQ